MTDQEVQQALMDLNQRILDIESQLYSIQHPNPVPPKPEVTVEYR